MITKAIKNGLTDEILKQMYEEGKTAKNISEKFGITENGVLYRLKKLGIKRRTNQDITEKRMIDRTGKSIYSLTKEALEDLLKERGERQIAKEFGCSRQVLKTLRDKYGIKPYNKTERIHLKLNKWFTPEQESMFYGSVLGDANICLSNNKQTARYKESHCEKQSDYLRWKSEIIGEFISKKGFDRGSSKIWKDGRELSCVLVRTKYHRNFKVIYDWFYDSNGIKHLPDNFEEKINPLALAVWYMDDGSLHGNIPKIASCFSEEDVFRVCDVLKRKFNIDSKFKKYDSVTIIHFEKDRFFNIINEYIVESMAYKVCLKNRFSLKCINKKHLEKYIEMNNISITDENINDLVDYCHIYGFPYSQLKEYDRVQIVDKIKKMNVIINNDQIKPGCGVGNDFLICNFKNFFLSHRYGQWSAMWYFEKNLIKVLRDMKKNNISLTMSALRSKLIDLSGVYGFRPIVAKQIYDKYCNDNSRVLDPCGGWGGRMLGAYCSDKVIKYDCMEACAETKYGLQHLKMLMDRTVPNKQVDVYYGSYEDSNFTPDFYDIIFTSPPYFLKEFYSNDKTQSSEKYKDFNKWCDGFLKPFVEKSLVYLKNGGYFIVNIDDVKIGNNKYNICEKFENYINNLEKFEKVEILKMISKNRFNGSESYEPIYVYKKVRE